MDRLRKPVLAVVALAALTALVACQPAPSTARTIPPAKFGAPGNLIEGGLGSVLNPMRNPAGTNDYSCKPTTAHPNPVVLVHGTMGNAYDSWSGLGPVLKSFGYCVFAVNYGAAESSLFKGTGDIPTSAAQIGRFVDDVRSATGAAKVDLVGHSQGGMMPNYYIKFLGGATKVRTFVGLSPSNHGTTLSGIVTLGANLNLIGFANTILWASGLSGLQQQMAGSSFQKNLFASGDTVAGPRYVVIQTRYDLVVTPYRNAFLNGAENILIQDQCPNDPVGHVGMFADGPVLQNVMNELGANTTGFRATCSGYGLPL